MVHRITAQAFARWAEVTTAMAASAHLIHVFILRKKHNAMYEVRWCRLTL
jgi:hypothetical protein